mmetsp:Transcript_112736/g.364088  ORF Transcript_112736/g.364088 Transcript_112736/m.364088 type:complete len:208 (-) Transcript_112736:79-702(-)
MGLRLRSTTQRCGSRPSDCEHGMGLGVEPPLGPLVGVLLYHLRHSSPAAHHGSDRLELRLRAAASSRGCVGRRRRASPQPAIASRLDIASHTFADGDVALRPEVQPRRSPQCMPGRRTSPPRHVRCLGVDVRALPFCDRTSATGGTLTSTSQAPWMKSARFDISRQLSSFSQLGSSFLSRCSNSLSPKYCTMLAGLPESMPRCCPAW